MKVYCLTCNTVHVTCGEPGYTSPLPRPATPPLPPLGGGCLGAVSETPKGQAIDYVNRRLDALEQELRYAISCNKEAIERESANRKALVELLERRMGALEKQAGQIGKLYVTDVDPALGTVTFDIEDPKDALIRDLVHCFDDRRTYPPEEYALSRKNLRDRAEKLGVKL